MRKIEKGDSPEALVTWKQRNPRSHYNDLSNSNTHQTIREAIRQACTKEQFYLCAYCCKQISGDSKDTVNKHLSPQSRTPHLSMDFHNIVASCNTKNQCDDAHGAAILPLTPLMPECETELEFSDSSRVVGKTERARESIKLLNLDNEKLIQKRKRLIDTMRYTNDLDPNTIQMEKPSTLKKLLENLQAPKNGKLPPFSPILVNI